jgi:hypothetical protein
MLGEVRLSHAERQKLELKRGIATVEGLAGKRVDFLERAKGYLVLLASSATSP